MVMASLSLSLALWDVHLNLSSVTTRPISKRRFGTSPSLRGKKLTRNLDSLKNSLRSSKTKMALFGRVRSTWASYQRWILSTIQDLIGLSLKAQLAKTVREIPMTFSPVLKQVMHDKSLVPLQRDRTDPPSLLEWSIRIRYASFSLPVLKTLSSS